MTDLVTFAPDKIDLIKRTIAKDASNDELALFLHICKRAGLDPLAKQIYFQKRVNRKTGESNLTIITGIDGYRATAARTGEYAGSDDPVFDNEDKPTKATVTVYRIVGGQRCPFSASARWNQYYPGDSLGFMWNKMPHLMLGKCAEALALRKAFPNELSGIYTKEEMDQAQSEDSGSKVNSSATRRELVQLDTSTDGPSHGSGGQIERNLKAEIKRDSTEIYTGTTAQQNKIREHCIKEKIDEKYWSDIDTHLMNKPYTKINVGLAIKSALGAGA